MARVGYVQGSAVGLEEFCGLPAAQARPMAGQWIAVEPGQELGTSTYADVTAGITLSSIAGELDVTGTPVLVKPATAGGLRADGLRGTSAPASGLPQPAAITLFAAPSAPRHPVLLQVRGSGFKYQVSFTRWHEKLRLAAPSGALAAGDVTPAG